MYREIFSKKENQPTWAVHKTGSPDELVHPTIPFVGKNYLEQPKKILVYASAENLADYYVDENGENNWEDNWLDNDKKAENRHRGCFEEPSFQEGHLFFPHVHLEPMNNGCLATVVYYIASKLLGVKYENPKEFYETIAFGNYGKFSIETQLQETFRKKPSLTSKEKKSLKKDKTMKKFNKDYAGNGDLLSVSNEFIKADLKILQPDIIIMPKSIYKTNKKFISRFNHVESRAKGMGRNLKDMTLAEMDELWDEAKPLAR